MKLAVDTNRYTDLCRDVAGVAETLERAERIYVPFVVLAELRAGFAVGKRGVHNERRSDLHPCPFPRLEVAVAQANQVSPHTSSGLCVLVTDHRPDA